MKKSLTLFTCVLSVLIQAMDSNPLSMMLHGTVITLYKGSLFDLDGKVDLIVVGRNQQKKLESSEFMWPITKIDCNNCIMYERNKKDESDSEDDTYKPFFIDRKQESWKEPHKKTMTSKMIMVTESVLAAEYGEEDEKNNVGIFWQSRELKSKRSISLLWDVYPEDKAMGKLAHDLKQCYKNALSEGVKISNKEHRRIAIATLGTEVGVAHKIATIIAVTAIKDFIKNNLGVYEEIVIVMRKKFELCWYDILFSLETFNTFLGLPGS